MGAAPEFTLEPAPLWWAVIQTWRNFADHLGGVPTRYAMPGDPIHQHIEAVTSRPEAETRRLIALIFCRCWPGGSGDRANRRALEWLRRWGPSRGIAEPSPCCCPHGHCPQCN